MLYALLLRLHEDRLIKATLMAASGPQAFRLLQLTRLGREAARVEVDPFENVAIEAGRMLRSDGFARAFPGAFQPWADAEQLLWQPDAEAQLTTIGHKVREATQNFAAAMVTNYGVDGEQHEPREVERRLGGVIASHREELGEDRRKLLESLGTLWRSANKLIQRQEHGAQKEGESVTWDDARRIVFLTMFLMIEFVSIFETLPGPRVAVLEPQGRHFSGA